METEFRLYNILKDIFFWLDNGDRHLLEEYQLSVPRYYLLHHISNNPGISLTQLSALMFNDKSNITRMIRGLEADDLVFRKRHSQDGRTWSLFISPTGQSLLEEASARHRKYIQDRFQDIEEIEDLYQNLADMKESLQHKMQALPRMTSDR